MERLGAWLAGHNLPGTAELSEAAIHFAAFSLVGESVKNPAKYYDN